MIVGNTINQHRDCTNTIPINRRIDLIAQPYHIPEFLKRYGTIAPFSQQGVEKLNDLITQDYFKSTNHRDAVIQIMLKLNQLEELRDKGCVRVKEILELVTKIHNSIDVI